MTWCWPRSSGARLPWKAADRRARVAVVVFPGSNCDTDTLRGLELAGAEAVPLWHEVADLGGVAAVVLPGGFAYGDYLRAGVIARFSPVMRSVAAFAGGNLVLCECAPGGGASLTADIAARIGSTFAAAERVKLMYGGFTDGPPIFSTSSPPTASA